MSPMALRSVLIWAVTLGLVVGFIVYAQKANFALDRPEFATGYTLFGVILGLALFNMRKRFSMVPLGRASHWLVVHVVGGMLAIALYFIHTGTLWPSGNYEKALALVFYLVSVSGLFGYLIQRIYPRRLVQTGFEVIYERIPAEVAELREQAEDIVRRCTEETASDTLAHHYLETLSWYFRKPRFFWSYASGGRASELWRANQYRLVARYLNDAERAYLDRLHELAEAKSKIDFHYACQSVMKHWLLVHVPLAAAALGLMFWHVTVVNVYAL